MRNVLILSFVLSSSITAAEPDAGKSAAALKGLAAALEAKPKSLAELAGKDFAKVPLTKADAAAARAKIVEAHIAFLKVERAEEHTAKKLTEGKLVMPYSFKEFGKKPVDGRSLWISMHGGGNAGKRVNDQQWENQKKLYTLDEGIYLAPRAPTDTWNLWHEAHIDRMFGRMIENFIALEGIHPDKVYILGYSAGGDGAYQLAPRMADRWAAAAMMAGHPNDASPLSLRNVPFALQVGGNDAAYKRNTIVTEWNEKLNALQKDDPKGYDHFYKLHEGKPHWMSLEDKIALPWMAKKTRNPIPDRVVWKQTGKPESKNPVLHDRSYWLAVPKGQAKPSTLVTAMRDGQTVKVGEVEGVSTLLVRFDDRMQDLDKPVKIVRGDKELFTGTVNRTIATLLATLADRGDPKLMFDAETTVKLD